MLRLVSFLFGIVGIFTFVDAQGSHTVPQGPRSLPGIKLPKAPKIDGVLAPGEWPDGARGEGFKDKGTGTVSDEKAEFWIGYDDRHVYFSARAMTNPTKIVAEEYRQNVNLQGNDSFLLALDGLSSGQDFDVFTINAQGATNLRLAGGRAAKTEWLGDFEAVVFSLYLVCKTD